MVDIVFRPTTSHLAFDPPGPVRLVGSLRRQRTADRVGCCRSVVPAVAIPDTVERIAHIGSPQLEDRQLCFHACVGVECSQLGGKHRTEIDWDPDLGLKI